jgi:hypothetical protein
LRQVHLRGDFGDRKRRIFLDDREDFSVGQVHPKLHEILEVSSKKAIKPRNINVIFRRPVDPSGTTE